MKIFTLFSVALASWMLLPLLAPLSSAFSPSITSLSQKAAISIPSASTTQLFQKRISDKRRQELGIGDDEDEYDLDKALERNTDPLISKIVAGSFILVMIALLVVGLIIPYTTDYGEGVCNPLLTAGRC
jgi:hypothetical protein